MGCIITRFLVRLTITVFFFTAFTFISPNCQAADRTIDGSNNNGSFGTTNSPMIRQGYFATGFGPGETIIDDSVRGNAREISNAIFEQTASETSARGLSDYIWGWGQFVSHDTSLTTESNGPAVNGFNPIAVTNPQDPLVGQIPFVRSNWASSGRVRSPVNEVTSYMDGSQIYGSDETRASALRTAGGLGPKLKMSANNLLPINTMGLNVENNGSLPDTQLFAAGDIRSGENILLSSIHTVFAREHNRLVDLIAQKHPTMDDEAQYQMARKVVGAQIQAITYREYLPALLGDGPTVPKADDYQFSTQMSPEVTTAFAQAAGRYGHSTVGSQFMLVNNEGQTVGEIPVRDGSYNPGLLTETPENLELLLKGASMQVSQEIDTKMVDDLRTFLFGPPGAGGLDLASLNIQRGRDVGLPSYPELVLSAQLPGGVFPASFADITSDPVKQAELASVYTDVSKVDAWVGMLAEDHEQGGSVGPLLRHHIEEQYRRLRDGDRFFYKGPDAGLYTNGVLNSDIEELVDLESVKLSDIIELNTNLDNMAENVFLAFVPGDYNRDGLVTTEDSDFWAANFGTDNISADGNNDGIVDAADYTFWRDAYTASLADVSVVPEPASGLVAAFFCLFGLWTCRNRRTRS